MTGHTGGYSGSKSGADMRPPTSAPSAVFDQITAAYLGADRVAAANADRRWNRRRSRYLDLLLIITATVASAAIMAILIGLAIRVWAWLL